jgi:hypothetical protein
MNSEKSSCTINCGTPFVSLLAVAFIILKLTGFIDWGWIWVLAPIWITGIITVVALAILLIAYVYSD